MVDALRHPVGFVISDEVVVLDLDQFVVVALSLSAIGWLGNRALEQIRRTGLLAHVVSVVLEMKDLFVVFETIVQDRLPLMVRAANHRVCPHWLVIPWRQMHLLFIRRLGFSPEPKLQS